MMDPGPSQGEPLPFTVAKVREGLADHEKRISAVERYEGRIDALESEFKPDGRVSALEADAAKNERRLVGEYDPVSNTVRPGLLQTNAEMLRGQRILLRYGLPMVGVIMLCALVVVALIVFSGNAAGNFGAFLHGLATGKGAV